MGQGSRVTLFSRRTEEQFINNPNGGCRLSALRLAASFYPGSNRQRGGRGTFPTFHLYKLGGKILEHTHAERKMLSLSHEGFKRLALSSIN